MLSCTLGRWLSSLCLQLGCGLTFASLATRAKLTGMIRDFWWGVEKGKRKMAWLAWDRIILKNVWGGLGFKNLRLFNQALLERQAWRLITIPNSPCARILKARYHARGHLVDTAFCTNPSKTDLASHKAWPEFAKEMYYLASWWRQSNSHLERPLDPKGGYI
jgi:hypothetical protein